MSAFQKVGHLLRKKILVGERKLEAAVTGFFGKKLQQKQVLGYLEVESVSKRSSAITFVLLAIISQIIINSSISRDEYLIL